MNAVRHGRPSRRQDVWLRRAGGESSLYDPVTRSVHLLNDTARAIWDLCDGETEPQEMIQAICDLSRASWEVVAEDVDRILGEFEDVKLITWTEG